MLNGRPLTGDPNSILSQLSADNIENIEILTSPSSKYDADGLGGIINIKSKINNIDGNSLSLSINAGLPSIENYDNKKPQERYGISAVYNYRKNRLDLLVGFDYLRDDRSGQRIGYVNTLRNNTLSEFPSQGERSYNQSNYALNFSLNYKVSENGSFNVSAYKGQRYQARIADILYDQKRTLLNKDVLQPIDYFNDFLNNNLNSTNGQIINRQSVYNENLRIRNGDFSFISLDYTYNLKKIDAVIKMSSLFEWAQLGGPTDNFNYNNLSKTTLYQYQYNFNDNPLSASRLQLDFSKKIKNINFEAGLQQRYTTHPGDFTFQELDLAKNELYIVPEFTNRIDLKRQILSIYTQISGVSKKLQYTFGIRAENTDRVVDIKNPKNTFNFDTFNIFPNITLDYKILDEWNMKFGFNQRIQRNTTNMLTPFPEREHSETLEQGDAMLVPEYITNVEFTLQKKGKQNNFYTTLYNRKIRNVVNRVNTVFNDSILNRIYTNAGTATISGLEIGSSIKISKILKANLTTNIFNYSIKGSLFNEIISTSKWQYSINSSIDIVLPFGINSQFSINYLSRRITAQGIDSRFYTPNLSFTKTINNRISVFVNWINIDVGMFKTNEQAIDTWRQDFYTHTNYIHEVDIIKIGANYKFNQISNKFKKEEFGWQEF